MTLLPSFDTSSLQAILPALFSFSLVFILVSAYRSAAHKGQLSSTSPSNTEKQPIVANAAPFAASESSWILPVAEPISEIYSNDAPKYRPFKWGEYNLTMGIRFIPQTEWFTLYRSYPSYMRLRRLQHLQKGDNVVDIVPHPTNRNAIACLEVARAMACFLSAKYPQLFKLHLVEGKGNDAGSFGENIRGITRLECKEMNLEEAHWTLFDIGKGGDNPMQVAGELVPDDLAILLPDDDAEPDERGFLQYRFIGGSICTPGFWRLKDKLNLTLQQIHLEGKVPDYSTKLKDPMDRFFTKMQPGGHRLAERNNYFFQILSKSESPEKVRRLIDGTLIPDLVPGEEGDLLDDRTELTWGISTNGPIEYWDASTKGPRPREGVEIEEPKPINDPQYLVMRTERQTLRKMPKSKAVIFTIHTHIVPVQTMAEEVGVPGRLAAAMRSWPEGVNWYKGAPLYKECILPFLDEKHQEQIRNGVIPNEEEEMKKSKRAYPL